MNPAQLSKHWRLWSAACRAQGWKTSDDQKRYEQYSIALASVGRGSCRADREPDNLQPENLPSTRRHSVKDFTSQSQIDALFDHLTQLATHHTSLAAAIRQADPDAGDRKRLIWSIKEKADEAYIRHIALNKFGNADLGVMPIYQLTQLRNTLAARQTTKAKRRLLPADPSDRHETKRELATAAKTTERWGEAPAEPLEESNIPF